MNTRNVDRRTLWAVLAMEAGLALPIISLPSQGDRIAGVLGPLLLLLLLPVGYLAARRISELRDPSWRLLSGIGAALLTRAIVSSVPELGLGGLTVWLGHSFVPAAIGVGLWWRGGALSVAELTASEVRTEFGVLAVCMLGVLALVRPFVLADQLLLGAAVGLFAVGGFLALTFARQDAAEVPGRALAATTALVPIGLTVALVSVLQPALLGAMWTTLARLVELVLIPIGWFLAWLASLLPHGQPAGPPPLPPRQAPDFTPDPAALAQLQDRVGWIGTLVLIVLMAAAALAAVLVVRVMLDNWLRPPAPAEARHAPAVEAEHSGTARGDARALLSWLRRWLSGHVGFRRRNPTGHGSPSSAPRPADAAAVDAWAAYRRLLEWAAAQGLGRRPAETTGQLRSRLAAHAPDATAAVDLVTSTYEQQRYGEISPARDRLQRLRAALTSLTTR